VRKFKFGRGFAKKEYNYDFFDITYFTPLLRFRPTLLATEIVAVQPLDPITHFFDVTYIVDVKTKFKFGR